MQHDELILSVRRDIQAHENNNDGSIEWVEILHGLQEHLAELEAAREESRLYEDAHMPKTPPFLLSEFYLVNEKGELYTMDHPRRTFSTYVLEEAERRRLQWLASGTCKRVTIETATIEFENTPAHCISLTQYQLNRLIQLVKNQKAMLGRDNELLKRLDRQNENGMQMFYVTTYHKPSPSSPHCYFVETTGYNEASLAVANFSHIMNEHGTPPPPFKYLCQLMSEDDHFVVDYFNTATSRLEKLVLETIPGMLDTTYATNNILRGEDDA